MKLLPFLLLLTTTSIWAQQPIQSGKITKSTSFQAGEYKLPGAAGDVFLDSLTGLKCSPVLTIEGNDIEVDFQKAKMVGTINPQRPDLFNGVAILVKGNRITLKNARISGYKVAIMAYNCTDLKLIDCDVSFNYRPRLGSTREREDLADWLSYHQNDLDQWLRYGSGIYLRNCLRAEVQGCSAKGNQNALLMHHCSEAKVWNNRFQFNSGLGIGLYHCSRNRIMHNQLDWNVRGYSHGKYERGQDSAGILVYEQSDSNLVAYNSATHCGDGFFLWAGQTTMDTGQGGSNDNFIFGNDFSHAPTNGVEVTFSRNTIRGNLINECKYGIWGGYSFQSVIAGNLISDCNQAIAIEHGQRNTIKQNLLLDNKKGIALWANASEPADWNYSKKRDTRAVGNVVDRNVFLNTKLPLQVHNTDSTELNGENLFVGFEQLLDTKAPNRRLRFLRNDVHADAAPLEQAWTNTELTAQRSLNFSHTSLPEDPYKPLQVAVSELHEPDSLVGGLMAALPGDFPRGRQFILMDEWGPYDFRRPIAAIDTVSASGAVVTFTLLGPAGDWKVASSEGMERISEARGIVPAVLVAERKKGVKEMVIRFEYSSPEVVLTVFGERIQPGGKYYFELRY